MNDLTSQNGRSTAGASTTFDADGDERFQRLAKDYTRIKAQNSVLKKSLLQEQRARVDLEARAKEHEHDSRKRNQELETLAFHIKRLTKRCEALQQEASAPKSQSWLLGSSGGSLKKELEKLREQLDITNSELFDKVKQNEVLTTRLDDCQRIQDAKISDLHGSIVDKDQIISNLRQELSARDLATSFVPTEPVRVETFAVSASETTPIETTHKPSVGIKSSRDLIKLLLPRIPECAQVWVAYLHLSINSLGSNNEMASVALDLASLKSDVDNLSKGSLDSNIFGLLKSCISSFDRLLLAMCLALSSPDALSALCGNIQRSARSLLQLCDDLNNEHDENISTLADVSAEYCRQVGAFFQELTSNEFGSLVEIKDQLAGLADIFKSHFDTKTVHVHKARIEALECRFKIDELNKANESVLASYNEKETLLRAQLEQTLAELSTVQEKFTECKAVIDAQNTREYNDVATSSEELGLNNVGAQTSEVNIADDTLDNLPIVPFVHLQLDLEPSTSLSKARVDELVEVVRKLQSQLRTLRLATIDGLTSHNTSQNDQ